MWGISGAGLRERQIASMGMASGVGEVEFHNFRGKMVLARVLISVVELCVFVVLAGCFCAVKFVVIHCRH